MMTLQQQARSNLIVMAVFFFANAIVALTSVKFFRRTFSVELVAEYFALWTYGSLMFTILSTRRVFRLQKGSKKILFDERDQLINYRAMQYAYYVIVIFLAFGIISSTFGLGNTTISIPFYVLPLCLGSIALIVIFVYSIAVLVQYGWGNKHGE